MNHETRRLILRAWKEDDAQALYEYAQDPSVGPATGWAVHKNLEESQETIKNILMAPENYAIVLKQDSDNKLIGCISLMFSGDGVTAIGDNEYELGYWLGKPYWGKGYMPEAVNILVDYAFDKLGAERLVCGFFEGNEQSRRVIEKCGFVYDRTAKDIYWKELNENKNIIYYYLTEKNRQTSKKS